MHKKLQKEITGRTTNVFEMEVAKNIITTTNVFD